MISLTIVIPCYNEENRFQTDTFLEFYKNNDMSFCLVNDGSTDGPSKLLFDLKKGRESRIHVIDRADNKGKAESVREGMLYSEKNIDCDWIGFFDADLSTPLTEIAPMVRIVENDPSIKVVMGSRFKRMGGNIERKLNRFYLGRIFATVTANLLKLPVYDTQCGAKIFKKELIKPLFTNVFLSSWLFDVEILFRHINTFGIDVTKKVIVEYPLREWKEIAGSKLNFKDFLILPFQLIKLYFHHKKDSPKSTQ